MGKEYSVLVFTWTHQYQPLMLVISMQLLQPPSAIGIILKLE